MPFNKAGRKRSNAPEEGDHITLENAEQHMSQFISYYKGIGIIPEEEWKPFMESLFEPVPVTFRIGERSRRCINPYDARPNTVSEAEVLRDFLKKEVIPKISNVEIDSEKFRMTALPWYAKEMAWKTNINMNQFITCKELQPLRDFVFAEEKLLTVFKQDITSMIPVCLVDILPEHRILEMRAATGFMTAMLVEKLLSNPKKMPEGFLVANEKDTSKLEYRWCQGSNVVFTHQDLDKYPDLYLTPEHDPDSRVLYHRVFLCGTASNDGLVRVNKKARGTWEVNQGVKHHGELKRQIRRGLELLELNGQLVYITRSMNPVENEAVVAAILNEAPGLLQLVDVSHKVSEFHMRPGMTSWKVKSQNNTIYESFDSAPAWIQKEYEESLFTPSNVDALNIDRCIRVLPHDNDTTALFVAVFSKLGDLPWEKPVETKPKVEQMDTDGAAADTEPLKMEYRTPLRCDVNVCVAEIEYTEEITDAKLNTSTDVYSTTFDLPDMNISRSCIPLSLQKMIKEKKCGYHEVAPDNKDWIKIRDHFDIKRFDATANLLEYNGGKTFPTYVYCSPNVKKLILYNKHAVDHESKNAGGMSLMKGSYTGSSDLYTGGMTLLMPYVNKRLVSVPKSDLVILLQNKDVLFDMLSPQTMNALKARKDERGSIYFFSEPKGRNPDPRCVIVIRREKFCGYIRQSYSRFTNEDRHCLRLCGIVPAAEQQEEDMQTE
ncbi:RNA cytosine-C(5)-methyltransferase NSUN2-like [Mya arenaria]|uniref:RNA cytosine-C(5)-methyltransferase NSUN2-like n=1 Tax=Mya arenaria TaxID=6604 RepID=UPI0022E72A09|nr:RNA cytosine-C(5)-methyltransferase NSUN2-like [Mya arenaria]